MSENNENTSISTGQTVGKISHKYKSAGCSSVIVVETKETQMMLIPKDPLAAELDKDGQMITFDYRPLKMPSPEGCPAGMPAEITNISKK